MEPVSIIIKNQFSELERLAAETEPVLEAAGLPFAAIQGVNVAVEEIVTNVIKYAHTDGAEHPIEIRLAAADSAVTISVIDDGREFDPLAEPEPDLNAPIEERGIGGLGVHFVRKLMDAVEYRRDGGRNIFTMRKKVPAG